MCRVSPVGRLSTEKRGVQLGPTLRAQLKIRRPYGLTSSSLVSGTREVATCFGRAHCGEPTARNRSLDWFTDAGTNAIRRTTP
jgi:hypothetical protein